MGTVTSPSTRHTVARMLEILKNHGLNYGDAQRLLLQVATLGEIV